eukprot:2089409-Ditylum_brightwellii.AAC.1
MGIFYSVWILCVNKRGINGSLDFPSWSATAVLLIGGTEGKVHQWIYQQTGNMWSAMVQTLKSSPLAQFLVSHPRPHCHPHCHFINAAHMAPQTVPGQQSQFLLMIMAHMLQLL